MLMTVIQNFSEEFKDSQRSPSKRDVQLHMSISSQQTPLWEQPGEHGTRYEYETMIIPSSSLTSNKSKPISSCPWTVVKETVKTSSPTDKIEENIKQPKIQKKVYCEKVCLLKWMRKPLFWTIVTSRRAIIAIVSLERNMWLGTKRRLQNTIRSAEHTWKSTNQRLLTID